MSEDLTVTEMLRRQSPAAIALIHGEERVSYGELDDLAGRAAAGLAACGIGASDRVAFWLPNCSAYFAAYLACCRLGAIAVAVNTRFRAVEVGDIVARSGAKALLFWPGFRNIDFPGILADVPAENLTAVDSVILVGNDADLPSQLSHSRKLTYADLIDNPALTEDRGHPALGSNIFTTSGTTKAPKFVLHSQRSVTRHAADVTANLRHLIDGGGLLQVLPLCGVFGFTQAMAALNAGCPLAVMDAFDPYEAVRLIDAHDIRYLNATDDMIEALLAADPRDHALPSVRACGYGSFNTDPEVTIRQAEARGLRLVGLYGMSEVQALFSRQPEDATMEQRMLGGGDLVSPDAKVRVRDPETGEILPHGEQGEIEIAGPSLMTEYFENPEATAETLSDDGFVRSGDMGYTVSDRAFVYLARMGDALRLGGFLVSPVEIESHIQAHGSVAACQVVAVPIEGRNRAVAFVVLEGGAVLDEAALRAHCLTGLAKFKAPAAIFPLEEFPVTPSANGTKIQRAKLRQWALDWTREAGD